MHHRRPAGPPLSARTARALSRVPRIGPFPRRRVGRVALGMALSTAVTGFVLAVPVLSTGPTTGPTTAPMALDASSTSGSRFTEESSPVVMGRDGATTTSSSAAVPPTTGVPRTTTATSAEDSVTPGEPTATEVPASTVPSVPTPASAPDAAAATTATAGATTATAAAAAATTPAATRAPDLEVEVLALVNTARSTAGCAPLVADAGLADLARAHSADMRDRGFFGHENPDDLDESDRAEAAGQMHARAENIAHGQQDAAAVMDAWMDKSGHRANILDCAMRTLGVGIADGPDDRWWTLVFGD